MSVTRTRGGYVCPACVCRDGTKKGALFVYSTIRSMCEEWSKNTRRLKIAADRSNKRNFPEKREKMSNFNSIFAADEIFIVDDDIFTCWAIGSGETSHFRIVFVFAATTTKRRRRRKLPQLNRRDGNNKTFFSSFTSSPFRLLQGK